MTLLQQNNLAAFEVLYERHEGRLWNYFARRSPGRAEDLFQECFARLLERRDQWKGTPFLPWFLLMARNLLIDDVRKEKVRATSELHDVESLPQIDIDEWLEGVPAETKTMLKDHYLSGLSYGELAKKYHTQEATLRQKLSRALRAIRKEAT